MGITKLISIHPNLIVNLIIGALIALALALTKNPLVLLAIFALLFHSSQQVVPADVAYGADAIGSPADEEIIDDDDPGYSESKMGYLGDVKKVA